MKFAKTLAISVVALGVLPSVWGKNLRVVSLTNPSSAESLAGVDPPSLLEKDPGLPFSAKNSFVSEMESLTEYPAQEESRSTAKSNGGDPALEKEPSIKVQSFPQELVEEFDLEEFDHKEGNASAVMSRRLGNAGLVHPTTKSTKCVDMHKKEKYLHVDDCHGNWNQRFYVDYQGRIQMPHKGLCWDWSLSSHSPGDGKVKMSRCHGNSNQKWIFDGQSIKSKKDPSKCVTFEQSSSSQASENQLFMADCSGWSTEQWVVFWPTPHPTREPTPHPTPRPTYKKIARTPRPTPRPTRRRTRRPTHVNRNNPPTYRPTFGDTADTTMEDTTDATMG